MFDKLRLLTRVEVLLLSRKTASTQKQLVALGVVFLAVTLAIFGTAWMGERATVSAEPGVMTKMTAQQFQEFVKDSDIVFMEYYSPECSACQMAAPVLNKLVSEMDLTFAYIDIRYKQNQELAAELGVYATPTVFAFVNGEPVGEPLVGFAGEEGYRAYFESVLAMN